MDEWMVGSLVEDMIELMDEWKDEYWMNCRFICWRYDWTDGWMNELILNEWQVHSLKIWLNWWMNERMNIEWIVGSFVEDMIELMDGWMN